MNIEKVFTVWEGAVGALDLLTAGGQMALKTQKKVEISTPVYYAEI